MGTRKICLVVPVFFITACSYCMAQSGDWNALFAQAQSQFESAQYQEALATAQKVYALSSTDESRSQSISLLTAICVDGRNADEGLKYIESEIALLKKTGGDKSQGYEDALTKHVALLQLKGRYAEAIAKCETAQVVYKNNGEEGSARYYALQTLYADLLAENNNREKAKEIFASCLTGLAKLPDGGEEYLQALTLSAANDQKRNDMVAAEKEYRHVILILEKNNLTDSGDYVSARKALDEILSHGSGSVATPDGPEAKAVELLKAAVTFQNEGQSDKAEANYQQAVSEVQANHLQGNTAFSIYLNYGRLLTDLSKEDQASDFLNKAMTLAKAQYAAGSAEESYVYFALGDAAFAQGKILSAIDYYNKVSATGLKDSGPLRKLYSNTAIKLLNAEQGAAAAHLLATVVANENMLSALADQDKEPLVVLYCRAMNQTGYSPEATTLLNKMLSVPTTAATKAAYQIEMAEILTTTGEWRKAFQLLKSIDVKGLSVMQGADVFFEIAKTAQLLGEYAESEKSYREAIGRYGSGTRQQTGDLLQACNSLAILYTQLGNYDQAKALYVTLIEQNDKRSAFYVTLQQNLAALYVETLHYGDAMKILEAVTLIDKDRLGEHHSDYAISLQNLAAVCQKSGKLERAKELYTQALSIDEGNHGRNTLGYATKAANLGVVFMEMNDLRQAKVLLESALQVREQLLGKDHPDYVFNEYNLAVLYQRMNETSTAVLLFRHVASFYMQQIRELFPAMSEKEKTAFYNKIGEVIWAYQDFMIEQGGEHKELIGELLNFRLATKALLLNSSVKIRNRIQASGDPALQQHFQEWLQIKEDLGKLYTLRKEERALNKTQIEALQQKANELEKWLNSQSELFAGRNDAAPADWKAIQSKLKPDEVAIEMIRLRLNLKNDSVIYAALIVKSGMPQPVMVLLADGKTMEGREFSFYHNCIVFKVMNTRSYDIYWKAIDAYLKQAKTVYFSADGVYNKINVMTLYQPDAQQYLIDRLQVKQLTSLREFLFSSVRVPAKTASLVGYPDFKLGSSSTTSTSPTRALIGGNIPELPGTREEITKINDLLVKAQWKTKVYLSAEATEKAVKDQQNTGVIHIATHGFFIPSADNSVVVLTHDLDQAAYNPLLRCGLIMSGVDKLLSGAKTAETDDGILTAYEVMNLNIEKTGLVVLSACETGAGEVKNGEGVYGLQRAFLVAGTENVLMSLWKVDDTATQELMVDFYKQWDATGNKAQAFRNTQLEMKKKYGDPYFWGGFIMVGNN